MRRTKNHKAQIIGEYATTIALVVIMMITMTVYLRRVFQARIKDAKDYMVDAANAAYVSTREDGAFTPEGIDRDYEPYYINQETDISRETDDTLRLSTPPPGLPPPPGSYIGATGIFTKVFNETTTANTVSVPLPPWMAY